MANISDTVAILATTVPPAAAIVAGLGGYFLAGRNEEARDRRAAAREAEARRAALRERLEERRHTFHLEVLLELQDALRDHMRAVAKILSFDIRTLRAGNPLSQLPPDLSQEDYDTGVALGRLRVRVLDDKLRTAVSDFHWYLSGLELSAVNLKDETPDRALELLEVRERGMADKYIPISERIGELIRREVDRPLPD